MAKKITRKTKMEHTTSYTTFDFSNNPNSNNINN